MVYLFYVKIPEKSDYEAFIDGLLTSVERFQLLAEQNRNNNFEMLKLRQYMTATLPLLGEKDREAYECLVNGILEDADAGVASTLTFAIKRTLQVHFPDYLTVAKVRDELVTAGFDFSSYKSNELASVSTTLRRIQPEIEVRDNAGIAEYRMAPSGLPKSAAQVRQVVDSIRAGKLDIADQPVTAETRRKMREYWEKNTKK
jgi:hypothetical protein